MKILVVFLAVATICRGDEDDDGFDSDEDFMPMTIPSHVPRITPAIAHVKSSVPSAVSPAVMKIPKPGIRFDMPGPQTQTHVVPVENVIPSFGAAPATAPMPKTTLESATVPAPVAIPKLTPEATLGPTGIPMNLNSLLQGTFQTIPAHYPFTTNYGPQLHSAFEVSAGVPSTFGVPNVGAVAPVPTVRRLQTTSSASGAVPVPNPVPIHYTSNPFSMPFLGSHFQTRGLETPHPFTYWGGITNPQKLRNFVDFSNGGFSYVNVIRGDIPASSG